MIQKYFVRYCLQCFLLLLRSGKKIKRKRKEEWLLVESLLEKLNWFRISPKKRPILKYLPNSDQCIRLIIYIMVNVTVKKFPGKQSFVGYVRGVSVFSCIRTMSKSNELWYSLSFILCRSTSNINLESFFFLVDSREYLETLILF